MALSSHKTYLTQRGLVLIGITLASVLLAAGLLTDYPGISFAAVFGVLWIYLTLTRPMFGVILYAIFILIRPQEFIGFLDTALPIEKLIAAPLIVGVAFKLIRQWGSKVLLFNIDKTVLLFVIVTMLSVATSVWITLSWQKWLDIVRLFIIYVLIAKVIDNRRHFKQFVMFFVLTSVFHATASTINYYRGIREYEMGIWRACGVDTSFGDPNSLAATLVYSLPFLYYYLKSRPSRGMKVFLLLSVAICFWDVILTGSRTGMMGIGFMVFLTLFENRRHLVRNLLIGAIVVAGALVLMPGQYRDRLFSVTDFSSRTGAAMSAQGRVDGFKNGVQMMLDRPLLGVGVGMYAFALGSIYGKGYWSAHNLAGQLFGDLGILGTVVFILWLAALFKSISRLRRRFAGEDEENGPKTTEIALCDRIDGVSNRFMYNMVLALRMHVFLLLFLGLGGHNLYRYNWFIVSALLVAMLFMEFGQARGRPPTVPGRTDSQEAGSEHKVSRR